MAAEKSSDLPSKSWRPRKAIVQVPEKQDSQGQEQINTLDQSGQKGRTLPPPFRSIQDLKGLSEAHPH